MPEKWSPPVNKVIQELEDLAEDLGYKPGTPQYDRFLLGLKVERCREIRSLVSCSQCDAYEYCDLQKQHQAFALYGNPTKKKPDAR